MTHGLTRLFNPASIAVIGGGAWSEAVLQQAQKFGYKGKLYAVHPSKADVAGIETVKGAHLLPEAPDAAFIGINREASVGAVERLKKKGAGGAVCFASGFAEATAEDATGADAQERLLRAAGDMPILGPNCYGFINAFDRVAIWPDQHGLVPVERGVAILTQSSNISINLTMQARTLPIGYMVTCGNQAQLSQAHIAEALLDDPRVTAIGLHIEGFSDLPAWEHFARKAAQKGIPIVAVKVGASEQAQRATISHTASLAGHDTGAQALLDHLGISRCHDLAVFLETLKLLHFGGALASKNIASISCSGGEASLCADLGQQMGLSFPPLNKGQEKGLRDALGPMVALANPLDYHTYIWRDAERMADAWGQMVSDDVALTLIIVDFPRSDRCSREDWDCAVKAALTVKSRTKARIAMVATLPELMPEDVAAELASGDVIPLCGLADGLRAVLAAQRASPAISSGVLPGPERESVVLAEAEAKAALARFGISVPNHVLLEDRQKTEPLTQLTYPVAVKIQGLTHKTGAGGIALNLATPEDVARALTELREGPVLVEEMVQDGIAELLIGVIRDPAHGFILTLGAGGIYTELWQDTVNMLVPADETQIQEALNSLRVAALLRGYRGADAVDQGAILRAVMAVQAYVIENADTLEELEINPLLCTASHAVAVDALLRKTP